MRTLNLGIVAHVDAGKTSLTERLLFAAGVIDAVGRVDDGSTQTDTLAIERERGITVKSAVVSFVLDDVVVNLIDTPGHPDFIAEVDRVLRLLDGAVVVVSAVEGVQAQTRVLVRALQRLAVPTLFFVNKIDRAGARPDGVVADIGEQLSASTVAMSAARAVGAREVVSVPRGDDPAFTEELVTLLADHDDEVLERFIRGSALELSELRERLAVCARRATVHPVWFGSATTGAGVDEFVKEIPAFLPARQPPTAGPPSGVVFKVEHSLTGERTAIARMFAGTLRVRDRVAVGDDRRVAKVSGIAVFDGAHPESRGEVVGGQIARITGLGAVRIGDSIGTQPHRGESVFAPPSFDAIVSPAHDRDRTALHAALERLAAEDPLIDLRHDDLHGQLSVSLYGDVQREVIADALAREFGLAVEISESTTIHIERVIGVGEASEPMPRGRTPDTPFLAAVGIRIEPASSGAGITFSPGVQLGRLPLAFINAVDGGVRDTLRHGLHGWEIPDCTVRMTSSGYWPRQSRAHGTFDRNMSSVASDFRHLARLMVVEALRGAGTVVCEPVHRFRIEAPVDAASTVLRMLSVFHARCEPPEPIGSRVVLGGLVAAAHLQTVRHQLPGLTNGGGSLESTFHAYEPIHQPPPERPYPAPDPRDRATYLRQCR